MSNHTITNSIAALSPEQLRILIIAGFVAAAAMITLTYVFLTKSSWSLHHRGIRDGKKNAARPYVDGGWTSPFVERLVKLFNYKTSVLAHHAEQKQKHLYEQVTAVCADCEKLEASAKLQKERYENPVFETDNPEIQARRTKNHYERLDHIIYQKTDKSKKLSFFRTGIMTRRQKYLERYDGLKSRRDERINSYWAGVCQVMEDSPVIASYVYDDSEAHLTYLERNDHVLAIIDYYTEKYLQPDTDELLKI